MDFVEISFMLDTVRPTKFAITGQHIQLVLLDVDFFGAIESLHETLKRR